MKSLYKEIGIIILGTLVICLPVFFNGYPLLTYDGAAYIRSGFTGIVPIDRPLGYGLFIKYTSMGSSLWYTVLAQSFLLAAVIHLVLKKCLPAAKRDLIYLSILLLLVLFTNIGWCGGQIMADIFTPLFILTFIALLLFEDLPARTMFFLGAVFILCCTTHLTHLLMALAASVFLVLLWALLKWRRKPLFFSVKRLVVVAALSFASYITVGTINATHENGGGFKISRGSHVFLMAHFIEMGVMEEFLKKNCDKPEFKDCKTCLYKDSLEHTLGEYLWSWNSSLYKTGGWEGSEPEHKFIFKKMFSDPVFATKGILGSLKFGFRELFLTQVGYDVNPLEKDSPPWTEISQRFPWEMNSFLASKQNTEPFLTKKLEFVDLCNTILVIFSFCVMLYYFIRVKVRGREYMMGLLILFFYILNAFLTAGLNAPSPRFQGRVAWLLPFFFMVIFVNHRTAVLNYFKDRKK